MAFIFKVTTTSPSENFTIGCQNAGAFNATVDWGDGGGTSSITTYNDADLSHTYASAGTYTISITGTFPNIYMNNSASAPKIVEVVDLGDVGWTRLDNSFYGCTNLTSFATGTADTSSVTNMFQMFRDCSSLTSLDVSSFNTSSVTNMYQMLYGCSSLTSLDVSGFNTSSVTTMGYMFYNCSSLTSLNVSGFNTSSVTNMNSMFLNCSSLTSLDVSSFNTSSVTTMFQMFYGCSSLTSLDVSSFDTSSVTNMQSMFYLCSSLTSLDVSSFDTSSVTTMFIMFQNCSSLTSLDVSDFDTSSVTNMAYMFRNCSSLTSLDVSSFDTSSVTNMAYMFRNCSSLTSLDVSSFDTSSVTSMDFMFLGCTVLTGLRIRDWDVSSLTTATSFCLDANNALSTDEYNNVLINWGAQSVQSGVSIHFGDATYTAVGKYAVGIQMQGTMTYANTGATQEALLHRWYADANNRIQYRLQTSVSTDGTLHFTQIESGTGDTVSSSADAYAPGINVPFNIASRHGSTFINGAVDGTALTANTTPTALPDLSSANLDLGYDFMGTIDEFRMWGSMDIGDTTIAQATAPSLEPSLGLFFHSGDTSFTVRDWK